MDERSTGLVESVWKAAVGVPRLSSIIAPVALASSTAPGGIRAPGRGLEGQGLEHVPAEDAHRLAERLVDRRTSAAKIVVVQGRQVVVHEAEGMNQLEAAGGHHPSFARHAQEFAAAERDEGTDPLASAQQGVDHGLPQKLVTDPVRDQGQGVVDARPQDGVRGCFRWKSGLAAHVWILTGSNTLRATPALTYDHRMSEWLERLIELMDRGGLVMWPLLVMSVLSIALSFERFFYWRAMNRSVHRRYARFLEALRSGDRDGVRALSGADESAYGELAGRLVESADPEATSVEVVESQRPRIERYMLVFSTIVTSAPMLGILGTVLGIIRSFELLGAQETITDPRDISAGIAEALI